MLLTVSGSTSGYLQFVTVLLLFVFVLFITYLTTKWIAGYQKGKINGGNIEIIETQKITVNKYVQIIKVGTKYLVIAIGKDEVTKLTELEAEHLTFTEQPEMQNIDFKSIFEKVKNLNRKDPEDKN